MKKLTITPVGWPCRIEECPPGFFVSEDQLCFRSEYGGESFYNSAGEYFVLRNIIVQPVDYAWEEEDII